MVINALVEKNNEGFHTIISEQTIDGCYFSGYGDSVKEAKEDFLIGIQEMYEVLVEQGKTPTFNPNDIEVVYRYDIPSFFNDFDWINISAFAKMAGINESKMRAYKSGVATASEKTTKKIMTAVKSIAATMAAVSL